MRIAGICIDALVICVLGATPLLGAPPEKSLERLEERAFLEAVDRVASAVVQLQIIGGPERVDNVSLADGPATGVVLSPDGYVVTSLFRFSPAPASALAILPDGRQFAARLVATDHSRKLVLLKLQDAGDLPTVEPSSADSVRVGQWAIAVGRAYRADAPNVSVGIVSAQRRLLGREIQTDAAISAANYGGPLVDIHGRVLGILAPMSPSSEKSIAGIEWYDSGIGFAVPLEAWLPAFERLKSGEDLQAGALGITLHEGTPGETPPRIKAVIPKGPAANAGLAEGDLITAVDALTVATVTDLKFAVTPKYAGDTVAVQFERDDESQEASVVLATIAEVADGVETEE